MASLTCAHSICVELSKSAIVRATRRTLSCARAESPRSLTAARSNSIVTPPAGRILVSGDSSFWHWTVCQRIEIDLLAVNEPPKRHRAFDCSMYRYAWQPTHGRALLALPIEYQFDRVGVQKSFPCSVRPAGLCNGTRVADRPGIHTDRDSTPQST